MRFMKIGTATAVLAAWCLGALPASANNVTVANVALAPLANGLASVGFTLSWDNSWRDEENFDACWLFVKYTADNGLTWRHATLAESGTNTDHMSAGDNAALQVVVPADRKGALIQRAGEGSGNLTTANAALGWDFGADGVSSNASVRVRVFAVEMVYIPEGPFYVGSENSVSTTNSFWVTYINTPVVTATNPAGGNGTILNPYVNLISGMGLPWGITGTFSTNYPNGYKAFYVMKYEVSQGQYAAFLNTLPVDLAMAHYSGSPNTTRYSITGLVANGQASFTAGAPNRAMYFPDQAVGVVHATAYTAWAALRPTTEMEYEKMCRGPALPVDGEFAWGTTNRWIYNGVTNDATALEAPKEASTNANINLNGAAPTGPIRSGAFATNGSSRVKAGAGYYGVFELTGNVSERVVATGPAARTGTPYLNTSPGFSGAHGSGELDGGGYANVNSWPLSPGNRDYVRGRNHYGHRGFGFTHTALECTVGNRKYPEQDYTYSFDYGGCRGARSAN